MTKAAISVLFAAFVLHIVGFSTPYWYRYESRQEANPNNPNVFRTGRETHFGLWHYCTRNIEEKCTEDYCYRYNDDGRGIRIPAKLQSAQVFECFALISYVVALTCSILKFCILEKWISLTAISAVCCFTAGFFGILGVVIFGTICTIDEFKEYNGDRHYLDGANFHFSFAFCIIAVIGGILAGTLFVIAYRNDPLTKRGDNGKAVTYKKEDRHSKNGDPAKSGQSSTTPEETTDPLKVDIDSLTPEEFEKLFPHASIY